MATMDKDFQPETWWKTPTVSGGEVSGSENYWWGDRTRSRTGISDTYTSVDDLQGRLKTGRELDAPKL